MGWAAGWSRAAVAAGVLLMVGSAGVGAETTARRPVVFVDDALLARLKARVASGKAPWAEAWAKVREQADAGLKRAPAPYLGKDYFEFRAAGITDANAARDTALVFLVTGEEPYLRKAREILLAWAGSEPLPGSTETKTWAEAGKGLGTMPDMGLNVAEVSVAFASVYSLLYESLTAAERETCAKWLRFLAGEVREGHQAWIDNDYYGQQHYNNHLTGHLRALAAIGYVLRDDALVAYAYDSPENPRDFREMVNGVILMPGKPKSQFWFKDPRQETAPGEVYDRYRVLTIREGKGYGFGYAMVHLQFLTEMAEMAMLNGTDLYRTTGPHGENLKLAFEHYADTYITRNIALKGKYHANDRLFMHNLSIFEVASARYPESAKIRKALSANDRVRSIAGPLGYLTVLLHGESLEGGKEAER